ncbi:MAG: FAD:protein transferase [Modestobacter sp.]|jgi:thiamine biosynthesis lipoprotein|nr:FAD:protein transferase [Modestobacter sp.]
MRARGTGAAVPVATADWEAWTCQVRLAVTDPAALAEAQGLLTAELAAVDRACSRFRPDSELTGLDASAGGWVAVSPLLTEALAVALRAARLTGGAVDPTVGGAMVALGYDRDLAEVLPSGAPVVGVRVPGWQTVQLDRAGQRVRLPAGVHLDLGATAKAWTADRAAARIAAHTGCGVLVSLGGDVAVAGPAPAGGWRIRVQDVTGHPDDVPTGSSAVVTLGAGGLATSSTRARRWQRGGLDLTHLIDPQTGLPPVPAWRTVSAAAASCLDANTVSTATVVRGHDAWRWLRGTGIPVRLVGRSGDVLTAGGWPAEVAA